MMFLNQFHRAVVCGDDQIVIAGLETADCGADIPGGRQQIGRAQHVQFNHVDLDRIIDVLEIFPETGDHVVGPLVGSVVGGHVEQAFDFA